jgi:hypothetical protein
MCRYRPKTTSIHPHPQYFARDRFPRNTRENEGVPTEPAIRLRNVFTKLGIASSKNLVGLDLDDPSVEPVQTGQV